MKRDLELVRLLLLWCEQNFPTRDDEAILSLPGYEDDLVAYHLYLLVDAGYIVAIDISSMESSFPEYLPQHLTSRGHDYADMIRDPEIWRKTVKGARKIGSFSMELVGDLAKGLITTQIKKYTGVDVSEQ